MGASESGHRGDNSAEGYFNNSEKQKIQALLQKMVDEKSRISSEKFHSSLKERLTSQDLRSRLFEYLSSMSRSSGHSGHHRTGHVTRDEVILCLAHLFKGSAEQLAPLLIALASGSQQSANTDQLKQLFTSILQLSAKVLSQTEGYRSWHLAADYSTESFSDYLLSELNIKDDTALSSGELETCLMRFPFVQHLVRLAFHHVFPISDVNVSLLPTCNLLTAPKSSRSATPPSSVLDLWSVVCLNQAVPHEYRTEWRPLFNSKTQGESFATMLRSMMNCGPTMLVIRDSDGHVFGGFAAESWTMQPKFYGSSHCFLFSTSPSLAVYSPSGYNENYMYLNQHQQTLPNGLAMGGQFEYFGLWLSTDYGLGHSKAQPRCTTYSSPQLSKSTEFKIDDLEVWGIGPIKKSEQDEEDGASGQEKKKGVLNTNEELQNLVEMSGRTLVSREIRAADNRQERDQDALRVIGQSGEST